MEEVTDFAFREMFARYSKTKSTSPALRAPSPGLGEGNNVAGASLVMFTEFINVDGLTHPEGYKKLSIDLRYSEAQRPIVAQIWGRNPEKFFEAAKIIAGLGFDGIDINFGCPQAKEIAGGTCAALIREPKLSQEIIAATKEGAVRHTLSVPRLHSGHLPQGGRGSEVLPVSVKTRLGYSKTDEMGEWVKTLLETDIAALTLHGRTKQEMSKVPAHWDKIAEAVEIRNKMFPLNPHPFPSPRGRGKDVGLRPLIIGNGDIKSREEGLSRIAETGCDGVMVARGAFGHPWFFKFGGETPPASLEGVSPSNASASGLAASPSQSFDGRGVNPPAINLSFVQAYTPTVRERFRVMLEHAELFDKTFAGQKSFMIMRKHFKAYCSGFPGAHELRAKLMETKNLQETKEIVEEYLIHRIYE